MDTQLKNALAEGAVDALGFVAGALFGGLGKTAARKLLRRTPAAGAAAVPPPKKGRR